MTFLLGLSIALPCASAHAQIKITPEVARCVNMRLDDALAPRVGYALKRTKLHDIAVGNGPVAIQPRMAGLRGPSVTFLGRDVRLAVTTRQTSPQELWIKSLWNHDRDTACTMPQESIQKRVLRGLYWKGIVDNTFGFTTYQPRILLRSRLVGEAMLARPFGFVFGAGLSVPIVTNTRSLLDIPDDRPFVRRDMARYSYGMGVERLFASWRTTPITDLHMGFSAGLLEEMYGGAGAEVVYRPFGSAFWAGADGWEVWRRDPEAFLNMAPEDGRRFTGHVRAGYDLPDTRTSFSIAAGRYLAGDTGATLSAVQSFESGLRITASLTWTGRTEAEGFFTDTHFDPMIRAVWPLGGKTSHREIRATMRQVGRDGGQMLDRPLPIETMTEAFSSREIIRHWPDMLK